MINIQKLIVVILLLAEIIVSQNIGKIAGKVRDKQTNEPLIGANVRVKGTTLGNSSDEEGFYFILRVPPGVYDLQVTMLGYHTVTIQSVRVQVDLTTEINVRMESTDIQVPTVTITAEQKLVQKDVTSTRRTITKEAIKETPGLESAIDIFRTQAGTVLSTAPQAIRIGEDQSLQVRDESVKDIHVRGGRGGEILYLIDGMPVTHPLYGGREVVELNVVDVENIELLTGGFSAEFGQAQSGVVNITTRSGGERLTGGVEYKSDEVRFLGESYMTNYGSLYLGGPEPLSNLLFNILSITPIPTRFFISGNASLTNTPYNNNRKRGDYAIFGFDIREKQDNSSNLNAKINMDISSAIRLALSYHGTWKQWTTFEYLWKYFPDRTPAHIRNNNALNFSFNHILSNSTFYTINLGYLGVKYSASINGKKPTDFWRFDSSGTIPLEPILIEAHRDRYSGFYDNLGTPSIWRDDNTKTYTLKADFTSQVHKAHLIKTGIEVKYNDIQYIDIQDGGINLSYYGDYKYRGGQFFPKPPGPFSDFGKSRWVFNIQNALGGAYLQDKFELEYLILNGGIRLDWFWLGDAVTKKEWKKQWEDATGFIADWSEYKLKFSPRFGISFPISERTVVFFSYGHFNQLPELQSYYRDPYSGSLTGNPRLDYEQTILYEFGFTHQLADEWAIDIKSYAKDISKQVQTTLLRAALGLPVELFDNKGYGRARGLEFELTKQFADYTSGKLTYTIQWANGYSSSAFDDYIRSLNDFPYPIRERRVGWDIRHQIIFQGMLASTPNEPMSIFGVVLPSDWNITLLSRFSTGAPYTPGPATMDPAENQKQELSANGPITSSTDIKFEKRFNIGGIRLALILDIFNIFDEKNSQLDYNFNIWTGKPYKFGDIEQGYGKNLPNYYDYYTMLTLLDPRQFSTGRTAKIGMRVDF